MNKQQIGKCGELLVQYQLLLNGIESSPMTTDSGIDLVAFNATIKKAITIQVKTNEKPKPAGGKGKLELSWFVPTKCPATWLAFVDLSEQRTWLIPKENLDKLAQQNTDTHWHLYMHLDPPNSVCRKGLACGVDDFDNFFLKNQVHTLFE